MRLTSVVLFGMFLETNYDGRTKPVGDLILLEIVSAT
jgi:hypothetical protein